MPRVEDETFPPGQWLLVLAVVAFTVGIAGLAMVTT
jgi:hypothetical protein